MSDRAEFERLIEQVKQGNEDAAADLVRRFEPEIRRFIRFRMTSPSVRRFVDSFDVCQSVLGRFFSYLSENELDIADPQKLRAVLLTIARNKIYDVVARERAARRDVRRISAGSEEQLAITMDHGASPSQLLSAEELVSAIYNALPPEDRPLVEARMNGQEWSEVGKLAGCSEEAARKRINRAIEKAAQQLGLSECQS